jgi:hypothetical protein
VRNSIFALMFFYLAMIVGCTTTSPTVTSLKPSTQPLNLTRAKVAVFSFAGSPGQPETGPSAREITMTFLVQRYDITLVSPSKVDAYQKKHSITPTEFDRQALELAAESLGAEVVVWGSISQYTPYKFDRLAPATPPYVELTLFVLRVGHPVVAKATGHKQGGIPATVWNRQPTFEDVAKPLIQELFFSFR